MVILNFVAIILYRRASPHRIAHREHKARAFAFEVKQRQDHDELAQLDAEVKFSTKAADELEPLVQIARESKRREDALRTELAQIRQASAEAESSRATHAPNGNGQHAFGTAVETIPNEKRQS
jgi:hypothetical protein